MNQNTQPLDTLGRPLRDLRISVTDRCNFRCVYCMPKEVFHRDFAFLPQREVLSFEEISRVVQVATGLGVGKVRITGGEPLVRRDVPKLVEMLAGIQGVEDLTLTTIGALLPQFAQPLKDAGLHRVTVSLDSLRDDVFMAMNDASFPVKGVLDGIDAAAAAGLGPIKVNMVVKGGVNDGDILPMASHFRGSGHILRFIEYMDVGSTNGWSMQEVISAEEVVRRISAVYPLEQLEPNYESEVANRYRYADGQGEIGIIASVTQPFCGACARARLSADGQLYTCLFATRGHDLRALLRSGASDADLDAFLRGVWGARDDRYSELRTSQTVQAPKVEMSFIGG